MLHLPRRVIVQLAVFTVIAVGVLAITFLHFVRLPAMLFGVGRYTVTMELVEAGGLYRTGNVTYRGFEVGRVAAVRLTDTGVQAVLALKSGIDIPSDLKAEVHSHTAIGETYVELLPRNAASPPLKNGDVIALADTSVPPDINDLLSAANTALEAIPHENLQTVIDESYTNLNLNLPPPCTTGFLPAQQRRIPTFEDYPDRPAGDLYCRVPQDSPFNVRRARNIPCETVPGKRAPTVKLCESDEPYLPLNDGYNWKGDPNATVPGLGSGQDIPQTWQTMLLPPGS